MGRDAQVGLRTADLAFLERRGARSSRGPGEWNRGSVLSRSLETLRNLLDHYDPIKRGRLTSQLAELAIALLPEPWLLKRVEVETLERVLELAPDFHEKLTGAGLEPGEFLAAIERLEFGEKISLVDRAVRLHSPAASAAMPEEP